MLAYILRRIAVIPLLLLGVASVVFLLSQITKGDPLSALIPERMMGNAEVVATITKQWGLDKSLPERYGIYMTRLVQGDLGTSFTTRQPVTQDIGQRLPATLELVIAAMIFGCGSGIGLGVLAARFKNTAIDSFARITALIGSSLPVFWSGLILMFIFSVRLGWISGAGRLDARTQPPPGITGFYTVDSLLAGNLPLFFEALTHLILPAFVLGWSVTGILTRLIRSSLLEALSTDYVRTARAKGAPESVVLWHHALRNAMIPTLTVIGFAFAYLITGAVLTETIFSWPGIGAYAVSAARALDYPAIIGVTLIGAVSFLLANLVTDIAYAFANPRVKLEH
jgi:peptide/nickel transport system permease protein